MKNQNQKEKRSVQVLATEALRKSDFTRFVGGMLACFGLIGSVYVVLYLTAIIGAWYWGY